MNDQHRGIQDDLFTLALTNLSPSDPITMKYERVGAVQGKELVEAEKEAAGLNDPFLAQYRNWQDRCEVI